MTREFKPVTESLRAFHDALLLGFSSTRALHFNFYSINASLWLEHHTAFNSGDSKGRMIDVFILISKDIDILLHR